MMGCSFWMSRRLSLLIARVWGLLAAYFVLGITWSKIEFVKQPQGANANFLWWLFDRLGYWQIMAPLFIFDVCVLYFAWWFYNWTTKLPREPFACTIKDAALGTTLGSVLAVGIAANDQFDRWLTGRPVWDRQALELACVMLPTCLLIGATIGGLLLRIRRFGRNVRSQRDAH